MKENIFLVIKGFIMGIANVIPGVSGGTLALTLGIYEKLIKTISHFFKNLKDNTLNLNKEKTFDDLVVKNIKYYESVEKVFKFGMKRQEDAIKNFVDFFTNLIKAYEGKNT